MSQPNDIIINRRIFHPDGVAAQVTYNNQRNLKRSVFVFIAVLYTNKLNS